MQDGKKQSQLRSYIWKNSRDSRACSPTPSEARNREIRSPTSSPPPEGNNRPLEAFCHDELIKAGGRPVVPLEFLLHAAKDGADTEQFEP
ncbi:Uu.00g064980.m01.CDS01 [Anthostomella pinea]|uniref:Uu.00g064980.m01.CDS01 n=1 Tax=Anthostomella pinea TaxID=933095 RepID=A0AAI8VUW6_9PEZI|nr:Uu.00g064980.m01.CDS01 [Anthostomella pinea]